MQAAVELRPSDVVLDVTDAYPSVDRGLMFNELYGDTRLSHMWRSFDFLSCAGSCGRQSDICSV
jgi:hypothetical protein